MGIKKPLQNRTKQICLYKSKTQASSTSRKRKPTRFTTANLKETDFFFKKEVVSRRVYVIHVVLSRLEKQVISSGGRKFNTNAEIKQNNE